MRQTDCGTRPTDTAWSYLHALCPELALSYYNNIFTKLLLLFCIILYVIIMACYNNTFIIIIELNCGFRRGGGPVDEVVELRSIVRWVGGWMQSSNLMLYIYMNTHK